ncbi:lyase family protein [Streptomyces sp. NPDC101776]|uniref:lyase family protein n=1 Tax=Streptomyces sp. NPDC101776 TaxID=3366146 RepID=UPI003809F254
MRCAPAGPAPALGRPGRTGAAPARAAHPLADLAAGLAHAAETLSKITADVLVLARIEIGEVAEPAVAGRGASSAMPHKRNPVPAILIRSAALQASAQTTVLTQCLAAEDERSAGV